MLFRSREGERERICTQSPGLFLIPSEEKFEADAGGTVFMREFEGHYAYRALLWDLGDE